MQLGFTSGQLSLPVHSPLLQQSRLLSLPPLSDMLKFGGLLHVHQVTINNAVWAATHPVATDLCKQNTSQARLALGTLVLCV